MTVTESLLKVGKLTTTVLATAIGPTVLQEIPGGTANLNAVVDFVFSSGAGASLCNLPALAVFNETGDRNLGKTYTFKRLGSGTFTVVPNVGDLIDGGGSVTVTPDMVLAVVQFEDRTRQWQIMSSGSGVTRITRQDDLGEVIGGVITCTDPNYYLANTVVVEDGVSVVFDPAVNSNIVLRADAPNTRLVGNVGLGVAFVQFPNQGIVTQVSIQNEGAGDPLLFASRSTPIIDAGANFCILHEVGIISPSDFSPAQALVRVLGDDSGRFAPRIQITNSNIGSAATDGSIVLQDGRVDFMDISSTLLPNPSGPSISFQANFDGLVFGGNVNGGTLGIDLGVGTAIEREVGASILGPTAARPFLVQGVNINGGLVGFTSADEDVIFIGNQGVQNSIFLGDGGFTGNTTATVIGMATLFVNINDGGNMASNPEQQRFSRSGMEFTYLGTVQRNAHVTWHLGVTSAAGNPLMDCRVEVDTGSGFVALTNSTFRTEATNRETTFGSSARFLIQPGDIVRLTIANADNTNNLIVSTLSIDIEAM